MSWLWLIAGGFAAALTAGDALSAEEIKSDESVVVYADGRQQRAVLTAWDGRSLTVQPLADDAPQTLQVDEWLRFGPAIAEQVTPVQTPRSVWLVDGSRLAAKRLTVEGQECRIANHWCRLTIPVERIQAIQCNGPLDAASWFRLEQQLGAIEGADDAVLMVEGELRRGRMDLHAWQAAAFRSAVLPGEANQGRAEQGRGLPWQQGGRVEELALERIRAVVPSPALRQPVPVADGDVWVGTADGSRLRVRRVDGQGNWELACGQSLQTRGGEGSLEWLRSLAVGDPVQGLLAAEQPLRYRAVPVFGQPRPLRQWADGGSNGIEVAATSRLVYRVDGKGRLRGQVMVSAAGEAPVRASCRFTIQAAGAGGAVTTLWQSEPLSAGGQDVQSFDVPLDGRGLLILGSDSVSGGDRARPIWLDTILSKSPPP